MGKQQDREKIVQEIKIAADLYRKHLVGKIILYVFEVTVANNYYSENGYFIFEYTNAIRNGSGEFMIGRNNPELRYVCGQDFDSLYNDVMQNTQVQYNSELLEGINPEGNTQ